MENPLHNKTALKIIKIRIFKTIQNFITLCLVVSSPHMHKSVTQDMPHN